MKNLTLQNNLLRLNFLLSLSAILGSLYFSEVLKFPPCILCWYQRICLYPLVFIYGVGLWKEDKTCWSYAMPLQVIGLLIALYHNLLYYGFITEEIIPCQQGLSCKSKQLELYGFITIPLLSFVGFFVLNCLSFFGIRTQEEK